MSFSIDDLVSSFKSNHIGQEATDLANLHAQLAQTLRNQPSSGTQSATRRSYARCNTPLSCTPSSSFSWEPSDISRARSSSVAGPAQRRGTDERKRDADEMEEDERMVEDMLMSSPTASHFPQIHHNAPSSASSQSSMSHVSYSGSYEPELSSPNTSLFATTDPFFAAALQAAQGPPPSFFAQAGRPSAHSPFVLAQQFQSAYSHSHHNAPAEVDPHHIFAAPPAAFTC
ncbi:uncharacterized protein LAESUDRAFT_739995 [Laetiporus sulphureus 93-53]|uniref:Uncharacterized protein n=1 Tax=Laetiporus sulphureus 93-53 TaxID=1314785 RepID=A0A165I6A4_9APHY|nr:uncharacterized protein LAESUDRAFT_739995 [Laetiporus sulphureus 93-53]KZT12649.1 hypothetical protein LAESUDRAFT_739995 [Laetiporus sulphureus 93-53]